MRWDEAKLVVSQQFPFPNNNKANLEHGFKNHLKETLFTLVKESSTLFSPKLR
jgi:hypothetical protein